MPQRDIPDSLYAALQQRVGSDADAEFLRVSGESFTYRQALALVQATARGLMDLGVEPGDRVGVMCGNCPESVWAWLGANAARAIDVPFNTEVRGRLLDYVVTDAAPKVVVGTADYLSILAKDTTYAPAVVVVVGVVAEAAPFGDRARHVSFEELLAAGSASDTAVVAPGPSETATIMYTSGTTGPSKGVMLPQRYYPTKADCAIELMGLGENEVYYLVQPLFHIDARAYVSTCLYNGGLVALGARFSVRNFWNEVRENHATVFGTIGTMLWLLYKQAPTVNDADIPARVAICSATPTEIHRDFEQRFGVKIIEGYGMTECVLITAVPRIETRPGSIGRAVPGVDVRIVDEHDAPVEPGETGQLIFRPTEHNAMMQGYWGKPEATVEAWRNLWFHTGDLVRADHDGWIEYIGRQKDMIRRRGENVSAWEVEQAVAAHAKVQDVAAIGVASEVGEEDVAVLVVAVEGAALDPQELVEFVSRDLPRFAVPRYVEFVDSLPKTPSERVEKAKVRARGISAAAWDATAALSRR